MGIIFTPWFQGKVGQWWHLTYEPRINVGMRNKLLCRPGVSKLINQVPNHHTRITTESTVSQTEPKLEKKTPPHYTGEVDGSSDSLLNSQSYMHPPYSWNDWGNSWMSSRSFPLTQSSRGSSHSVHKWCGPMTITRLHIWLQWVSFKGLQWCKPQWLNPHWWIWHSAWHLKAESIHQNKHQTYKNTKWWEAQLWKRNLSVEDPWNYGISLKGHLRWRLLLLHSGKDNYTSRVP